MHSLAPLLRAALLLAIYSHYSAMVAAQDPEPSTEELIRLAPQIDTLESPPRQILIEGRIAVPQLPSTSFRLLWRRELGSELVWSDTADGTPFLVCANGRALLYDAREGCLHYLAGMEPSLQLGYKSVRTIHFSIGCRTMGPLDGLSPAGVVIDLKSILREEGCDVTVAKSDDGSYELKSVSPKGSTVVAHVDRSKSCPFTRIEFLPPPDEKGSALVVTRLEIDGELLPLGLTIPPLKELEESLPVQAGTATDMQKITEQVMLSALLRLAVAKPEIRPQLDQFPPLRDIDWDTFARADREFSTLVRRILKIHAAESEPGDRNTPPCPRPPKADQRRSQETENEASDCLGECEVVRMNDAAPAFDEHLDQIQQQAPPRE